MKTFGTGLSGGSGLSGLSGRWRPLALMIGIHGNQDKNRHGKPFHSYRLSFLSFFIAPAGKRFDRFVPPPLRGAPFSKGARILPIESLVLNTLRHQPHRCELLNPAHVPFSSFPACTIVQPLRQLR